MCLFVCECVQIFKLKNPHGAPRFWPNEIWVKVILRHVAVKLLAPQFTAASHGIGIEKEAEKEEEEDDDWCAEGSSFWPFKTGLCEMTKLGVYVKNGSDSDIQTGSSEHWDPVI